MRKNIILLILIVQQAACLHQSFYKLLNHRASLHPNNAIARSGEFSPLERPFVRSSPPDETRHQYFANSYPRTLYSMDDIGPVLRQDDRSIEALDQRMPNNIFFAKRNKSPDSFNLEKLTHLLNNYNQNPIQPKMDIEAAGNKKRTHLFGFWTNYLARN